jgi:hypothetical protein
MDSELRLEALRIAASNAVSGAPSTKIVSDAEVLYAFLHGGREDLLRPKDIQNKDRETCPE